VPALESLIATRIVATPAALDGAISGAQWSAGSLPLRTAPDEILIIHTSSTSIRLSEAHPLADPHAIIVPEGSFLGTWLPLAEALVFLERACAWELPAARPAFAQGAVANVPVKLWFERDRVLFVVQSPFAADFEERLR
jgi:hypothetical protein